LDGDCLGELIAGAIGLFLLFKLLEIALTGLYWVVASLSYWLITGLEWLFSSSLNPGRPAVMWAVWGVVLGAVLGFYPIAPVYGLKKFRGALIWLVFAAMVAVAFIR
jgi:hypothetical protein